MENKEIDDSEIESIQDAFGILLIDRLKDLEKIPPTLATCLAMIRYINTYLYNVSFDDDLLDSPSFDYYNAVDNSIISVAKLEASLRKVIVFGGKKTYLEQLPFIYVG